MKTTTKYFIIQQSFLPIVGELLPVVSADT